MGRKDKAADPLVLRVARIAGQVRGVRRMIAEGRPCLEIAGQLSAVAAALKQVRLRLLAAHLRPCEPAPGQPWQPQSLRKRVEEICLTLAGVQSAKPLPTRVRRTAATGTGGRKP